MNARNVTRWLFVVALCAAAGLGATARAELIFYDPFDGVTGELVVDAGLWSHAGSARTELWTFGSGNLAVPDGVNLMAPSGSMIVYESDPENYVTSAIYNLGRSFDRIGTSEDPRGVLYMSYLQYHEHSNLRTNQNEWAGAVLTSSPVSGVSRPAIFSGKDSGSADRYRLESVSNGNNANFTGFLDSEVRFIVTKFEWDLRVEDDLGDPQTPWARGQVWVNPDCLLSEEDNVGARKINSTNFFIVTGAQDRSWGGRGGSGTEEDPYYPLYSATGFDQILINAGSWGTPPAHNLDIVAFDEFRLGTTWEVITPTGAQFELGDFNGDGVLSGLDIPGFKTALADPDGWAAANPSRPHPNDLGDFNSDGVFSGLDIPGFKTALAGGAAAIPEPATALVLLSAAAWVLKRRRSA